MWWMIEGHFKHYQKLNAETNVLPFVKRTAPVAARLAA